MIKEIFSLRKYWKEIKAKGLKSVPHWAQECDGMEVKDGVIVGTAYCATPSWTTFRRVNPDGTLIKRVSSKPSNKNQ